ncbi:MAG: hypothetical protein Q9173_007020 [Seirophora scorigena]
MTMASACQPSTVVGPVRPKIGFTTSRHANSWHPAKPCTKLQKLYKIYDVYWEVAIDKLYAKVERTGSELILSQGHYHEILYPFPHFLLPDEKEKKAMLTYLACDDACGYMNVVLKTTLEAHPLLKLFHMMNLRLTGVKGTSIKLREAPTKVKARTPLNIRIFHENGEEDLSEYQHQVHLVTLKDAPVHVDDLAGAQYGCHKPVMPRKLYEESRAVQILPDKSYTFGWQRQRMKEACTANWGSEWAWGGSSLLFMPLPTIAEGQRTRTFASIQSTLVTFVEAPLA